jgi:hypothetical protein
MKLAQAGAQRLAATKSPVTIPEHPKRREQKDQKIRKVRRDGTRTTIEPQTHGFLIFLTFLFSPLGSSDPEPALGL